MDEANELGEQYRIEDVHNLVAQGHELASHTYSHMSCGDVPLHRFREDVRKGREAILHQMGIADSGNFAYPYGAVTLRAKKALGLLMHSCRGTTGGVNGPEADLNLLHANSLYGDMAQLEGVRRLIVENEKKKGWLIFYTHDVRSRPSRFGCTPALLEATVTLAFERKARIVTVAQALTMFEERHSEADPQRLELSNWESKNTGCGPADSQRDNHSGSQH
jgi:peptidoglycan/xylan/chitin deacetylase (PgdA/CDA1 family)